MTKWISVKDKLPEKSDILVLCKGNRGNPEVSWFVIEKGEYFFMASNQHYQYTSVTHWQEMPEETE